MIIEILKLGRDFFKSNGIIALAVLLISVALIVDFAVDRKMPSL